MALLSNNSLIMSSAILISRIHTRWIRIDRVARRAAFTLRTGYFDMTDMCRSLSCFATPMVCEAERQSSRLLLDCTAHAVDRRHGALSLTIDIDSA
jgi:hypothetical protein